MKQISLVLAMLISLSAYGNPDKILPIPLKNPIALSKIIEDAEITAAVKSALDALVGAGKYIVDNVDSEKKADGSSSVSTTITLFEKAGVDLSAIYKDKKIIAMEVEFPEELTINFGNLDQIVDNKLSAYLPDGFPMNTGIWVQSLAATFDNSSKVIPNLIEATIVLGSPWELLGVGSLQANEVNLTFAVDNPKLSSRTITGTINATANLGNIPLSIESILSSDTDNNGITAKIEQVNLKNVLDAAVGNEAQQFLALVPDLFKSLELSNAAFSIFPVQKSLNLKATTSLGGVIFDLSRSSGAQKVMFALRPPPSFKFSELASILTPMDGLDMSGSYFIVSNKQTQLSNKFLDPTSTNDGKYDVKKGLNLVTSIDLPANLQEMLKVKNISLVGSMPPSFNGINIYGKIETNLSLGDGALSFDEIGAGLLLEAGEVELRLEGAGSFKAGQERVQIYGGLIMSATDQVVEFEAGLSAGGRRALKPESCLTPQAEWSDPFGIPGAGIRSLGIRSGIGAKFPWINTVGLEGKVRLGTVKNQSKHICGGLTAYVSLADPTESMLIAEVRNLKPISFIEAYAENVSIQGGLRDALNTGIEQAKLKIVPKEMELFGQTYSRGIALDSAKVSLAGINGLIGFSFGEQGIKAYGSMDPYIIEEGGYTFFGIKGARPDALGNITGPSVSLGLDAADPHFKLNGSINLLGIEREAFVEINKNGFEFETKGNVLNGALGVTATVKAGKFTANSGLYVSATFENRLQTMVADKLLLFIKEETKKNQAAYREAQKVLNEAKTNNDFEQFWVDAANETVGAFKEMDRGAAIAGSYVVKGLLKDALNVQKLSFAGELTSIKGKVEIEVDMTIAGQSLKEKVKADLTLSEEAFTDLIVSLIGDEVVEFFGQLDNQVADAFDDLGDELEGAFEDLGNEIIKGAEVVGGGVIDAAEFLGNGIIDGFNAVDNFFQGSKYTPPVSNGTWSGIPPGHSHIKVTVHSIKVTDDEGGFTPALELFGSVALNVGSNVKTNAGATPFLYGRSARNSKEVAEGNKISVETHKDLFVETGSLNQYGATIQVLSKMSEWNDSEANQENLSGSITSKVQNWPINHRESSSFSATDGDGETISISYTIQLVGQRDPIPTPDQMMAVMKSGNMNEVNRMVSNGGQLRAKGMIEAAVQGNLHQSIVNRLISEGNRPKTSQLVLATNSNYYNKEIVSTLLLAGARPNEETLLNVVSRNDIPMASEIMRYKAVPQLSHVQTAIKNKNTQMVNTLMNASKVLQVGSGELLFAVNQNDVNLAKLFIERGAVATPLMFTQAIEAGNSQMVYALLQAGDADHTALQAAANKNDAVLFKTLIDNRVSLENNGPINTAIDKSNYDIIALGLNNGASAEATLEYAISRNNKQAIMMALDRGANGTPALAFAIKSSDNALFKDIINNHGGDANQGMTLAYNANLLSTAQIALDAGANPNTQLAKASSEGKTAWVKAMLAKNANPDPGMKGAVDGQHNEVVKLLIEAGAKTSGGAYIQSAAQNKNLPLVKILVEDGDTDPEFGRAIAIDNNDVPMVEYLLSKGAKATGLKKPAQNGWFEMVKVLIKYKADPNEGIQEAISATKNDIAIYLLDAGADATPKPYIEMAAWKGSDGLVAKLLEKGANPNNGTFNASKYKRVATMKMLIKAKADVSRAALMDAAVSNFQEEMIVLLLANGGDTQFVIPKNKETYLHRVADKKGQARLVKIFIEAGIPVDAVDKNQETALHKAVRTGKKNVAAVQYLIDAGANVNAKDKRGRSVLKRANNKAAKELVSAAGGVK